MHVGVGVGVSRTWEVDGGVTLGGKSSREIIFGADTWNKLVAEGRDELHRERGVVGGSRSGNGRSNTLAGESLIVRMM